MNNALAYFGGFLVVVLAALFAVPAMVDWNGYRGVFEEEASKVLGREVRVGGAVNLRLLPTPFVRFEKVRLADISGQTGEPFIRVESFTMRLSGPALLRGVFEATDVELNKPALTLALDGSGGGNWGSITLRPGALPFVPRDVALRSVRMIDGAISVHAPDNASVTRIDAINGELSADGLQGPFRFKGVANWSGEQREIRFTTTPPEAGGFRIKATTRSPATGNMFSLDARVDDFASAPKVIGDLTGKIAVPGVEADAEPAPLTIDFKSAIATDAAGATLSEIAMSLENAAEPQIVNGTATAVWLGAQRLDVTLTSNWLDLDRLSGAGTNAAPFQKIQKLALGVIGAVAGDGAAAARIDVAQIKIGGETTGGLKIDAERRGGTVQINELRAGLPGGSRLGLTGAVKTNEAGARNFAGDGFINGTSLARLKGWAEKSGITIDIGPDGAFSAEGKVRISGQRLEVTEASAEIGGRMITGEIKIIDDGRRRAEIVVESPEIERSDLFPKITKSLEAAVRRAAGLGVDDAQPGGNAENMDISLRVLAGRLKRSGETYRDIDATVALEKGNVRISSARFSTEGGLKVTVDGRIDTKAGKPAGALSFDAVAGSARAMRDLVATFGLDSVVPAERAERLGTASLAGLVRFGARTTRSADVSVDGLLGKAKFSAFGSFDDGLASWRNGASQTRIRLEAQNVGDLSVAIGAPPNGAVAGAGGAVSLAMSTIGVIEKNAAARIDVAGEGLQAGFDGSLNWRDGEPVGAEGRLSLASRDVADVLVLAGIGSATGLRNQPVNGLLELERQGGELTLESQRLSIGGATVTGTLNLAKGSDGAAVVAGSIASDHVVVAKLIAPLVNVSIAPPPSSGAISVTPDPEAAGPARVTGWPDGAFAFGALDGLKGKVIIDYGQLTLADGLTARSGQLTASFEPGSVSFTDIGGDVASGRLSGDVTLTSGPSGVAGAGKFGLTGVELATFSPKARGKADVTFDVDGRALGPAALIASLTGSGKLTLHDACVVGPGPEAARAIVDDLLKSNLAKDANAVTIALRDGLAESTADLGSRTVDLKVVNGVASIAPIEITGPPGTATATAFLDLNTWSVASLWKVSPTPSRELPPEAEWPPGWTPAAAKGPLPALSMETTAQLNALSAAVSSLEVASLQRELAARHLEQNVEELERLRKGDEERVRLERERRRLMLEERAKAAAEARARRDAERQQPQVDPESLAAPSQGPPPADATGAGTAPIDAPQATSGANGDPASATEAPPVAGAAATPAAPAGDPAIAGDNPATVATDGAAADPALAPAPVARPRPARRAEPRRTSSDEMMRSIGGYP